MESDVVAGGELTADLRQKLERVSVGTAIYVLQHKGYFHCFMPVRPVTPATPRFAGIARTLRTEPLREDIAAERKKAPKAEDPHRIAIDEISSGEVLVIAARGDHNSAVIGDLLAQRIRVRGGAAVVTDGCVRDLPAIRATGLPVFAAGPHAATFSHGHVAIDVNVPVGCGGVLVIPGDLIIGDEEGVAVIPARLIDEVIEACLEQERLDEFTLGKITQGISLGESYPLSPSLRAEYERTTPEAPRVRANEDASTRAGGSS